MKIKDLPKLKMSREKMARYGVGRMGDYELLVILLGSGIKGERIKISTLLNIAVH